MPEKPTLNPDRLAQHYGLGENDEPAAIRTVSRRSPNRVARSEKTKFTKTKTLLAIGAIAAGPVVGTKLGDYLHNQEHGPWQHNHPAQVHKP